MVRYQCDSCHDLKVPRDEWVLGLAAEEIGTLSTRREITFEPAWDAARACHPLAVHFCSVECKDNYLKAMFGKSMTTEAAVSVPLPASTRSASAQKRTRRRAS